MNLTPNFTRKEFRCKGNDCCGSSAPISMELVEALQQLRDLLGVPLKVKSGFRCLTYNRKIKSEDTSQHPLGNAADIQLPEGMSMEYFVEAAEMIPAFNEGGIGRYPKKKFVHLDVRKGRARWEEK